MRIRFQMEGGLAYFPGLRKLVEIDCEALPADECSALKQMLDAAHFFDLPTVVSPPARGVADKRQYIITVDDGKKHHTVRLMDPIENANLQALVAYMQAKRQAPGLS